MKNLPHPPPYQQWHNIYDHCHKCKQVAVKNEMVEIATNERLCVECAAKHIQEQDQTIKGLAKSYADINAVNGCLEKKNDELRAALHTIERDNDELREALEAFANEICQRRMLGFVQDAVFERVNNNQVCRTAITDTGYKGTK